MPANKSAHLLQFPPHCFTYPHAHWLLAAAINLQLYCAMPISHSLFLGFDDLPSSNELQN